MYGAPAVKPQFSSAFVVLVDLSEDALDLTAWSVVIS